MNFFASLFGMATAARNDAAAADQTSVDLFDSVQVD
jgi:hypothetical protein